MKLTKLLVFLLVIYGFFLTTLINDSFMNSDAASHAMTGVFFKRFFTDFINNPTFNPSAIYSYVFAYYARYPKFVFQYGPIYPLINSLISDNQFLMKTINCVIASISVFLVFLIIKKLFDETTGFLAALILATSGKFISLAISVTPNIPAFFFFLIGFNFYLHRRKKISYSIISGLFFGLSVLTKEFTIVYVGAVCLLTLRGFNTASKSNWFLFGSIALVIGLYFIGLMSVGAADLLLAYPEKQAWYGSIRGHAQWFQLRGWLYVPELIADYFSIIGLLIFLVGLYFVYKKGDKNIPLFLLIIYIGITLVSDKTHRRLLPATLFLSGVMAYGFVKLFNTFKNYYAKSSIIFFFVLMMFLVPIRHGFSVPMSEVAVDLTNECPNCTVFIVSEVGDVYSSFLMYESLIRDPNVSMRFIRPIVLSSASVDEVIQAEKVNRLVVFGDTEFLINDYPLEVLDQSKIDDYVGQALYVLTNYTILKEYDSDIVNKIYVLDSGVNEIKEPPFCTSSIAMKKSFCTNYSSPLMALQ